VFSNFPRACSNELKRVKFVVSNISMMKTYGRQWKSIDEGNSLVRNGGRNSYGFPHMRITSVRGKKKKKPVLKSWKRLQRVTHFLI